VGDRSSKKEEAGGDATLVCPLCRSPLAWGSTTLACRACNRRYPVDEGIADFSEGKYYDEFPGPHVLSEEALRGLANERESARIENYYLSKISGLSAGRGFGEKLRVLDSGCGNGESVDALLAAGLDAWGHDLSALRKWQWRTRARRDRLVVADGNALPFPDGFFDAVIASGVLEHIGVNEKGGARYSVAPLPDRDARRASFLSSLLRVLSKNGFLFLDFPNGAFPIDFWHGTKTGGARWHSTHEGFLPTLREVGSLCAGLDGALTVTPLSPHRRLRFNQVAGHWYGRLFRLPMKAFFGLMSVPGFRFLAGSPLNPYLVLEIRRGDRENPSEKGRTSARP
jgi:SAM-dependent methyltransferase